MTGHACSCATCKTAILPVSDVRHVEDQLRLTHQRARLLRASMVFVLVQHFLRVAHHPVAVREQVFHLALDFVGLPFFALCLISLVISIYYSIRDVVLSLAALELELSSARAKGMRS